MVRAEDTVNGRLYRGTRSQPGTYYTRPPRRTAVETFRRWDRHSHKLAGAMHFTYQRLKEGWVLMRRHVRFIDAKDKRRERTEWAAIEPDYELRQVKRAPGYN